MSLFDGYFFLGRMSIYSYTFCSVSSLDFNLLGMVMLILWREIIGLD